MMQNKVALAVLTGAVVLGVATGAVAVAVDRGDDSTQARPRASASVSPSPSEEPSEKAAAPQVTTGGSAQGQSQAPPQLLPASGLLITPGAVGPVRAGMSKKEAVATGYLVADVEDPGTGCPVPPLTWKDEYADTFDVQTSGNGDVLSIGVRKAGPKTRSGFGVGSTWGQIKDVASPPEEAGYGQTGAYVYESDDATWIGFLVDTPIDDLSDESVVTFVELTKGGQPGLIRDGC